MSLPTSLACPCSPPTPFLMCPMVTPSACLRSPLTPLRSSRPSLSPPPNPICSCRFTPRLRRHSLLGRPPGAPPLSPLPLTCESWLISCAPSPPSYSPLCGHPPPHLCLTSRPSCCAHVPSSLSITSPPSSRGPLRTLALPLALLPLAPAVDIACTDKDICNRKGGVVARWLVAGGSASPRKSPSRPRVVAGDGISPPLFLHLPNP